MPTPAAVRWSRLIDEHEASGLSVREFARSRHLNPGTLSWWRWRLRRTAPRQNESHFIELVAQREPCELRDHGYEPVSLVLDSLGVRVEVDRMTDLRLLRQVLEALC